MEFQLFHLTFFPTSRSYRSSLLGIPVGIIARTLNPKSWDTLIQHPACSLSPCQYTLARSRGVLDEQPISHQSRANISHGQAMVRLTECTVSGLEVMRGVRADLKEGQNHVSRHTPHVRALNGLQARRGCCYLWQ